MSIPAPSKFGFAPVSARENIPEGLLVKISIECEGNSCELGEYHFAIADTFHQLLTKIAQTPIDQDEMKKLITVMNAANEAWRALHFFTPKKTS